MRSECRPWTKANPCWEVLCRTRSVGGTVVEWYNGSVNRLGNRDRQRGLMP